MDIDNLLKEARGIWSDKKLTQEEIIIRLGVVFGDICRSSRDCQEGGKINDQEVKKEMGNLIFSVIRWCDDLGYDPKECVALAQQAQRRYSQAR